LLNIAHCCVCGIEYTVLDHAHVAHRPADQNPVEVVQSRQLIRNPAHVPIHAKWKNREADPVTRHAVEALIELATEVPAMHRTSQRKSLDLGELLKIFFNP
jgi:hypothetical protein